jgi:hypothetical protein
MITTMEVVWNGAHNGRSEDLLLAERVLPRPAAGRVSERRTGPDYRRLLQVLAQRPMTMEQIAMELGWTLTRVNGAIYLPLKRGQVSVIGEVVNARNRVCRVYATRPGAMS